jgi:hypothetical protein
MYDVMFLNGKARLGTAALSVARPGSVRQGLDLYFTVEVLRWRAFLPWFDASA